MAISITSPQFSFVQFNEGIPKEDCFVPEAFCLPVYSELDIRFHFFINATGDDLTALNATPGGPNSAEIAFILSQECEDYDSDSTVKPVAYGSVLHQIAEVDGITGISHVGRVFFVNESSVLASIPTGECFYLIPVIRYRNSESVVYRNISLGCSNCFIVIEDECDTSRLSYNNRDNSFGFLYATDKYDAVSVPYYNRVRLPFILNGPQFPEEEKGYVKSNGQEVKLMHRIYKEYPIETSWWDEVIHERFIVATAHDNVLINCTFARVQDLSFRREKNIEIEWPDTYGVKTAKATGTLRLANARASLNTNCT